MRFKRYFSLLLAVLLVLMSFAFSASKAWAFDLPNSYISLWYSNPSDNVRVTKADGSSYKANTRLFDYDDISYRSELSSGSFSVSILTNRFSIPSNGCVLSGVLNLYKFPDNWGDIRIFMKVLIPKSSDPNNSWYSSYYEASVQRLSDDYLYYECQVDYDRSGMFFQDYYICFGDPDPDSRVYPTAPSSGESGLSTSLNLDFSTVRVRTLASAPSGTDKYQNNVSSGISQIKDSVQKGFSAVTGAIGGAASAVGEKIGQVKDAVVQQGQAVAQKVTEVKEAVIEKTTEIKNTVVEKTDEVKQTIIEKLAALGNFIIDGLKELFIPSEDYFPGLFERLNTFFSNRFGFLYFPIEHFISLVGKLMSLQDVAPSIAIPELAYEGQTFIPAMTYTFDFLSQEPFKTVHDYYLLAIDAALIAAFIGLLRRKYEEVMRN